MTNKKNKKDINGLDFEEAIEELSNIVETIEKGNTSLQASIDQYEYGMALIKRCRNILQSAEKKIEKISKDEKPDDSD